MTGSNAARAAGPPANACLVQCVSLLPCPLGIVSTAVFDSPPSLRTSSQTGVVTVGNACGAIRLLSSFGYAPSGAATSSDPAFAGPPSPQGEGFAASHAVGAAIGRPLLPQKRNRARQGSNDSHSAGARNVSGHWPPIPSGRRAVTTPTAPAHALPTAAGGYLW